MISHTKAFSRLKREQQKVLNYTILVCHAVPNLKKTIHGEEESVPYYEVAQPHYYKKSELKRLKKLAESYKLDTAKYTLISVFSFFEFYFKSVVEELIEFHGGKDNFISNTQLKHKKLLQISEEHSEVV